MNGRISLIKQPDTSKLFSMYDKNTVNNKCCGLQEPTIGQWIDTPLSKAFFSKENVQILQNGIRYGVYKKSNNQFIISPQDCDSLKIIMRSIFLSYSVNAPSNISEQIIKLNDMVLDYCINQVYSEAKGYIKYLEDISTLAVPMATPIVERQKDKNNYKMNNWF